MVGLQVVAGFPIAWEVRKLSQVGKQLEDMVECAAEGDPDFGVVLAAPVAELKESCCNTQSAAHFDLRGTKGVQVSDFNVQTNIF